MTSALVAHPQPAPPTSTTSTSSLHSLLLRSQPESSTPITYAPSSFSRRRPRTLYRYPSGELVIYDDAHRTVDRIINGKDGNVTKAGKRKVRFGKSVVRFSKGDEEIVDRVVGDVKDITDLSDEEGGRWRFVRRVGGGSGGSVWLAEQEGSHYDNEMIMGVKVIEKDGLNQSQTGLRRVVEERRALELVGSSDMLFVAGLEGAWQSKRRLYLGMRWFGMGDLGRVVRGRALREEVVKGLASEIVLGLGELRELGFVHRDLKVENVLLDTYGHVAIGDLGMVKYIGKPSLGGENGNLGKTSSFCGTRSSMAPEMIMGKDYGYSVDMWALGVLIYRLLTGKVPFGRGLLKLNGGQSSSVALFHEIKTAPVRYPDYLSEDAKSLLQGLFDRYVGDRFDLDEVKAHPWFKDVDWEQVKESVRLRRPTPYAEELLGGVKALVRMDSDHSPRSEGKFMSNVTLSRMGDEDEFTPPLQKSKKSSKLSPWISGKLFSSSKKSSCEKQRDKEANQEDQVKIWGYEYRPPSNVSSISSSPLVSRRNSRK